MKNDIVRALVEYITNADDAYALRGDQKGRIVVEVEHRKGNEPWSARIRDRATGMTLEELRDRIGRQGGRTSGFSEGLSVRGNLGLGSKDPACFGKVVFESVKDNKYSWFSIDDHGDRESSVQEITATTDIRERLQLPDGANGTTVEIQVTQRIPCPRHDTLSLQLSEHVLLRDIMQDPKREVYLLHASKAGAKRERLAFVPPATTLRVEKSDIPVPHFPGFTADITIVESDDAFEDVGRKSPFRRSGLLIKGRRAIYESTLFTFDGNRDALAFTGSIRCAGIDVVAKEWDDRAEKRLPGSINNPSPIISRRRDGLDEEHPLYQSLKSIAEAELAPLVSEREKKVRDRRRTVESEGTTKLLSELAKAATKFMEETADENELDLPSSGKGDRPVPLLAIIPGAMELTPNSQKVFTIMASTSGLPDTVDVSVDASPPDVISLSRSTVTLHPSRMREGLLTGTVRISAGSTLGATLVTASLASRVADAVVEVVPTEEPDDEPPPSELSFMKLKYRIVVNKARILRVRAPLGSYPPGTCLRVWTGHPGLHLESEDIVLKANTQQTWLEGEVRVKGKTFGIIAVVTAAGPDTVSAHTSVEVTQREESGPGFLPRLIPEVQGDQRAQWSADNSELLIMGEHPSLKPMLGEYAERYPGQDSPEVRMLLTELVADAVVRRLLLAKYRDEELDAAALYVEHYKLVGKLLTKAHAIRSKTVTG